MPKQSKLKDILLKILKDRTLSKKQILDELIKISDKKYSDKTINEALFKLLKEGKIDVVGYDLSIYDGIKRVQSLKSEGIMFTSIKQDLIDIEIMFKNLDSDEPDIVKNSYYSLRKIFMNRWSKIESNDLMKVDHDIETIYDNLLNYINTQESEVKRNLIKKYAIAFSDKEESDKILLQLIELSKLNY
ncbi:MAG: hypothetical protein QME14_01295 [Methanobacteriaceae archaeon]|nr:hypothetical protein [Methanobacteriaceae archaeon]